MSDKRTDPGQYYPGGRVIARHDVVPPQIVVQWSEIQGKPQIAPLPDRYREDDMKEKVNEIASKFAMALAVALVGWTAFAGVVVQKARMGSLWNDDQIVTNAYLTGENASGSVRTLPKYLWIYEADDPYPEDAAAYYRSRGDGKVDGGCSAVRDGGFLYRNFDFPLDERAEFVVKMSAANGRFASVGVAQVGTNLTENMVTSGKPEYSARYKWLPGATVDGINENGVVAEINVVDGDPQTTGWHTTGDLHPLAAVRWALDHATNAQHAATYLAANILFPQGWAQNFHYMIADERETWIVENGAASNVTAVAAKRVMTNFEILPDDYEGMGAERYQLLRGGANITNAWYTRAYSPDTNWASEFVEGDMEAIKAAWASLGTKEARRKTCEFWQTVHTSVYDLTNRTLRVAAQEQDDWYTFQVQSAGDVATAISNADRFRRFNTPFTDTITPKEDVAIYSVNTNGQAKGLGVFSIYNIFGHQIVSMSELRGTVLSLYGVDETGGNEAAAWLDIGGENEFLGYRSSATGTSFLIDPEKGYIGHNGKSFAFPTNSGTFALLSDIPAPQAETDPLSYHKTEDFTEGHVAIFDEDGNLVDPEYSSLTVKPGMDIDMEAYNIYNIGEMRRGSEDEGVEFYTDGFGRVVDGHGYWAQLPFADGVIALRDFDSLDEMLNKASGTNAAARAAIGAKIMPLIDQPVEQKINQSVSANLNTYVDGETGVEYEGKFYGGSLYYVPTGTVYPPNN